MSKITPAINYTDIKSSISFLDDAGLKVLTRDELIRAYIDNLYGVTLDKYFMSKNGENRLKTSLFNIPLYGYFYFDVCE